MDQALPQLDVKDNELARRLVSHWQQEFGSAAVLEEPFQHFRSGCIWPNDLYDQVLRYLPPQNLYRPLNIKQWVNAKGISTRDKCYLSETIELMDQERADFWRQIVLAITSESVKRLIFSKFKQDISLRLGVQPDEVENTEVYVGISITRDFEEYRLKPHPDGQPRVVTAQFYLPADDSQRDLGTSIYESVPLPRRLFNGRFREVKRMPFLPNTGYAFAVNDVPQRRSLHGRELIKSGSGVRDSILVSWLSDKSGKPRGPVWETHNRF